VNPYLDLVLKTNLEVPFDATVKLISYRNGTIINTLPINININPLTGLYTRLWIARDNSQMPQGQGYEWKNVNLASIIQVLPDSIVIEMDGGIDNKKVVFDLNETYYADMSYKFVVPLSVGPNFKVAIQDTMADLDSIVGELLNGNKITLTAFVTNDLPLDLTATVIPIDKDNRPIPGITIKPFTIKAGAKSTDPPAELIIEDNNKDNGISRMRGLIWQLRATTGTGMANKPLNPNNFIQIRLEAGLHGGVVVDLNDL
jgi:hypothetical protein